MQPRRFATKVPRGHRTIAEALAGHDRSDVVLSVKFGGMRGPDGAWHGLDGRPAGRPTHLLRPMTCGTALLLGAPASTV